MMYRCLHGQAPRYLADHLITSSDVASRLRLRSANRHHLIVPRCRLNTYDRRAFSIAGPTVWNSLPDELRDPACGPDSFKQFLKTVMFSLYKMCPAQVFCKRYALCACKTTFSLLTGSSSSLIVVNQYDLWYFAVCVPT